ncbi:MAG: translation initiation factor IF-2 associated domain-containing protein, partial [Burkholderiales bacterium]|nr:translation initiation factor IF-2 associated domain-containing protein [Burkholderiales bacterium]
MNVSQFAADLKMPPQHLLDQLRAAGVDKGGVDDPLTEQDKTKLLAYLRSVHGSVLDKPKVTLARKQTSEIKKSDATGKARTIQVEVKKKRVVLAPEPAEVVVATPEPVVAEPVVEIEPVALEVPEVVAAPEPVVEPTPEPVVEPVAIEPEPVVEVQAEAEPAAEAATPTAPPSVDRAAVLGAAELASREADQARQRALYERQAADARARQEREAARKAAAEQAALAAQQAAQKPAQTEHTLHKAAPKPGEAKKEAKPQTDVKKAAAPSKDGWGDGAKRRGGLKTRGGDSASGDWKSRKGGRGKGQDNAHGFAAPTEPQIKDVMIPETISVGDLAHK